MKEKHNNFSCRIAEREGESEENKSAALSSGEPKDNHGIIIELPRRNND